MIKVTKEKQEKPELQAHKGFREKLELLDPLVTMELTVNKEYKAQSEQMVLTAKLGQQELLVHKASKVKSDRKGSKVKKEIPAHRESKVKKVTLVLQVQTE